MSHSAYGGQAPAYDSYERLGPVPTLSSRTLRRKPLSVLIAEDTAEKLERTLGLWDLLGIGIGGTVGTGIFVLSGQIAHDQAGPAGLLSWIIAALCCTFTGLSYAEMAMRVSSAGSAYAYCYHILGEGAAVVAAWCLTLEYGVSGAAVARSWGDKSILWIQDNWSAEVASYLQYGPINIMGGLIQIAAVMLILSGMKLSKTVINGFTIAKLILIFFMVTVAFTVFNGDNFTPFLPPVEGTGDNAHYGWSGVIHGATSAYFGFIGYDEVCCMAAETKNPRKVMHKAVLGTIAGVTILYVLSFVSLIGLQSYVDINSTSGFVYAFKEAGLNYASQITAVGELLTLPLVVFVAFLANPRLFWAMAEDGLMPRAFAALDKDGNLFKGTLLLGVAMTIIAVCVPFDPLNDMVSAGCLIAVNLTNACIITVNHESKKPVLAGRISWALFILSGVCAFMWHDSLEIENPTIPVWVSGTMTAATVGLAIYLKVVCTTGEKAGNPVPPFQVPFLPFTPLFGMFCNWYLISALSVVGLLQITGFILLALLQYYLYGYHHSVAHKNDWRDILDAAGLKQRENSYDIDNSLNGDALVDPL